MTRLLRMCTLGACLALAEVAIPDWACETKLGGANSSQTVQGALRMSARKQAPVPAAEAATVAQLDWYIQQGTYDLLLVFYAPWCGHCQRFVMHDATGNPANAPIEVLNRELVSEMGPKLLKYDIQANGHPAQFEVQYVPTIYLRTKAGATWPYTGNAHDTAALKAWVKSGIVPAPAAPAAGAVELHADRARGSQTSAKVSSGSCQLPQPKRSPVQLHSMQKLQQAQAVSAASLASQLKKADTDLLIIFYAPWCGHCKTFVMHDANGSTENAPLELLNRELEEKEGPKVLKYDCQANKWPDQVQFKTEYVPTIYLVTKDGEKTMYEGNLDLESLEDFALQDVE